MFFTFTPPTLQRHVKHPYVLILVQGTLIRSQLKLLLRAAHNKQNSTPVQCPYLYFLLNPFPPLIESRGCACV